MLHWTFARRPASVVTPIGVLADPQPRLAPARPSARSDHARMLAHAATRRRAALGVDRDYWKACAPAAIARAASIRAAGGLARLP